MDAYFYKEIFFTKDLLLIYIFGLLHHKLMVWP